MSKLHFLNMTEMNPEEFSPAVWAYIGDAVYELFTRCYLLTGGPAKTKELHQGVTARVRATFQAGLIKQIEPYLNETETNILKRGRNIKSGRIPNNTDVITYRYSTAFEALIGYLYLSNQQERLMEILNKTIEISEEMTEN